MPNAVEAERSLLAALLHDNLLFDNISDFLKPEHFFEPLHRKIFEAFLFCINKGQLANSITLWPFFVDDELIKEYGGKEYLDTLSSYIVSLDYTKDYAQQIYDRYLRRKIILVGESMVSQAYKMDINNGALSQIENAESGLFKLASTSITKENRFSDAVGLAMKNAELAFKRSDHLVGVPSGFKSIDRYLGGLHKSDLLILAARPSMGKTAFVTNIAFQSAQLGNKVLFFSLEMSSEQLALRILGHESMIPSDKIRRGAVSDKDISKLSTISKKISNLSLFIDDTPALSIAGLRTRARRLKRQESINLIIIDYLQLMSSGGNHENRVQELSTITRSLKALAKDLDVPIIALSQLSRAVEQREDKRPQLSDLRESGTIEQDADVVMFVYREAYYESRKKPAEGSEKLEAWQARMDKIYNLADIIVAKQRHGPIRNIQMGFEESFTKFYDLSV
ncbi:replicative DNA helicase [Candidatus Nesciobacter abundans]|uniref:Replicative DNA helicase n=2 Tax=Candidatus Nesciobacter abundans TaxID=2601668 RepID=A0A5C0UIA1_9PROT|nr:replicative DNA helicase [Candidatus Nesciobacter abundans]